ncbi:hypothetical protein [Candidatus Marimicrobium litorale]|nr:hypothetical protein [Candidatus Marimicrobium litorale]
MRSNLPRQRNAGAGQVDYRIHPGGHEAIAAYALSGQSIAWMGLSHRAR